jgi:dipeptidyl aminopeptidase/acylaminoacyl peptidase
MAVVPFGRWPSPLTAASVARARRSCSALSSDGAALYWLESRPEEGGRQVLVRSEPGAPPAEVSPPGADLRSRVHEYGGGAYCVVPGGGTIAYVEGADQRVWLHGLGPDGAGGPGVALTGVSPPGVRTNHGDLRATGDGRFVLAVRERLADGGTDRSLVALGVGRPGHERLVGAGRDFFAAPRPDPTGRLLAWICWDHPDMPWDSSELWVGDLDLDAGGPAVTNPRLVAGGRAAADGEGASVGQPLWCADGTLAYVCDAGGWWWPWRWSLGGGTTPIVTDPAEYHGPDWTLRQATMAELADGSLACRRRSGGGDRIVLLGPGRGLMTTLDQPCVTVSAVCAHRGGPAWIGATPWSPAAVWAPDGGAPGPGSPVIEDPAPLLDRDDVSVGEPFCAPGEGDRAVPGLLYRPRLRDTAGPPGGRPPLVVFCHSGPTGNVEPGFDPMVQFLTTHGFAVALVDYAGSTGYGRPFRRSLEGGWGIVDSDDCTAAASFLAAEGSVERTAMAIRGSSAGGFTALCALARSSVFAAGTSLYGVTDLMALSAATHDFESRYNDRLVGPLPGAAEEFRRRSPVARVDDIDAAVLILQGLDDPVVPAAQATALVGALRARGRRCEYLAFAGEAHGFRRAETLEACAAAELAFYQEILCPEGPDPVVGGW